MKLEGNEGKNGKENRRTSFVAVTGLPNVGKSSLINAAIGCKAAIVSPKPQTTRGTVRGILTRGSVQTVFIDTPGFHKPKTLLGSLMIDRIKDSISGADVCLHVVSASRDSFELDKVIAKKAFSSKNPVILAINKIDLLERKSGVIELMKKFGEEFDYAGIIPVSAKTGEGKDELIDLIESLAVPSEFFFPEDEFTDKPIRNIIEEIVREKALNCLGGEVPHGMGVLVERVSDRSGKLTDVEATIYCERESHKGIIIGKGGAMLKKIGSYSRMDVEKILNRRVNLKMWVKVKNDWRNRSQVLRNLGYMA